MKVYHWHNNLYVAGTSQSGIQTAHAQVGMIAEFHQRIDVQEWMQDKTTILFKGGNHSSLLEMSEFLSMGYCPWYAFSESKEALNGAMTNVCVLPGQRLEDAAACYRKYGDSSFVQFDNRIFIPRIGDKYTCSHKLAIKKLNEDLRTYQRTISDKNEVLQKQTARVMVELHRNNGEQFSPWETELIKRIASGRLM
ncbi:MAG: hypothetical protein [Caudoviricetes sp.]|nr:MAG: hypothetical protein [Caudoviricetes sp.]